MSIENKWFAMSPSNPSEDKPSSAEISIYDQIGGFGVSALKRHGAKVITHVDSLAASMASVIAMAGDEIHMAENALLMIHNPWTASIGGADQLRKDADLLDKMQANIRNSYARSKYDPEELDALMAEETYFTAEEALEAGFIDKIETANLAAASINEMETLKEFDKVPQAKLDLIKINCQGKQIETMSAKAILLQGQIAEAVEANAALNVQINEINESLEKAVEAHALELTEAKDQTQKAISAKASELLAESGTPAVALDPTSNDAEPSNQKMTPEDFWEQYRAFDKRGDYSGKNDFYSEHKSVIGQ